MKLGENLQAYRKKTGLSQEEFAEKCEVSRQAIAKWESGESVPTIDKLIFLADYYGITLDELVGKEEKDDYTRLREIIERLTFSNDICEDEECNLISIIGRFIIYCREHLKMDSKTILDGVQTIFLSSNGE